MDNREGIVSISIGKLWFHVKGARESASFEYDREWRQVASALGLSKRKCEHMSSAFRSSFHT